MAWYERLDMWATLVVVGFVGFLMIRDRVRGLVATFGFRRLKVIEVGMGTEIGTRPTKLLTGTIPVRSTSNDQRPQHGPLALHRWWDSFVEHDAHIMIAGPTRSGKSTTARALLVERARTDDVLVLDPHAKFNDWGVPVIGDGRDFNAIADALAVVHGEFQRRFQPDEPTGDPLTVFVDEYPAIVAARPDVAVLVKQLLREAAKAKIRLVFLAQDANVKTLGIEGEGAVRSNMRMLLLGSLATAASPVAAAAVAAGDRAAVLMRPGGAVAVGVDGLQLFAERRIDPSVMWSVPSSPDAAVPEIAQIEAGTREPVPDDDGEPVLVSEKRAEAIRQIKAAGISTNVLATALGGKRSTTLAMIRDAVGE